MRRTTEALPEKCLQYPQGKCDTACYVAGTQRLKFGEVPISAGTSEPRDNSLRLVVQEAIANPDGLVRPHPELPN